MWVSGTPAMYGWQGEATAVDRPLYIFGRDLGSPVPVIISFKWEERAVFSELKNKSFISTLLALACKYDNYPLTYTVYVLVGDIPASSPRTPHNLIVLVIVTIVG